MNLDLGSTIWLDVTRRFLSFHRYFFSKAIPTAFARELSHHSHTHPDASFTTEKSMMGEHANGATDMKNCGVSPSSARHAHYLGLAAESIATHDHTNFTMGFAASDLGSPNWWEHTHLHTNVGSDSGGSAHTHTLVASFYAACSVCYPNGHNHGNGTLAVSSSGASHTHQVQTGSSYKTMNAISSDTPLSHRHVISSTGSVYSTTDGLHSHTLSGAPANAVCNLGYNHGHTVGTQPGSAQHPHQVMTGYTGYGGEAEAEGMGDGLTWVS